jgi:hypothetical protein
VLPAEEQAFFKLLLEHVPEIIKCERRFVEHGIHIFHFHLVAILFTKAGCKIHGFQLM